MIWLVAACIGALAVQSGARAQDAAVETPQDTAPPAAVVETSAAESPPQAEAQAVPDDKPAPDVSAQAAANTTLTTTTAATPVATESAEPGSSFINDMFLGPVGAVVGNAAYRATFYELGFTYESAPWLGDGAVLSGIVFHENRGAIFNSFLAIAAAAGAAASRQTHVYSHSDSNYHYYRGMTAAEQAAEQARIDRAMEGAADIASERPLSMTAHLYSEDLGSSVNGGALNVGLPFWINAWSGGIVIEPALSFAYAQRHRDTEFNLRKGNLGWFGGELTLRIPIVPFLGVVAHTVYGLSGDKPRFLDLGVEGTLGNRFALRGSWTQSSIRGQSAFATAGLRVEVAVRL